MKKSRKRSKYRLGTQKVMVPDKGSVDDVASPTLSMAAAGATAGSAFGPIGSLVGGAAGALTGFTEGMINKSGKNRANKLASDYNKYIDRNTVADDPHLMREQQFKKGTSSIHIKPENKGKFTAYKKRTGKTTEEALHSSDPHVRQMANFARNAKKWDHRHKYPDGTQGIKLTSDELMALHSVKDDPETYRQTIWNMIGYQPKKYPYGSEGWKQQEGHYNTAVDYVNQGFRPFVKSTGEVGYKRKYEDGAMGTSEAKPIEVEKDELVFRRKGNKYRLKADFKGGKTHEEGGEDYVAKEGDVIFPGKDRKKVLSAYHRGDHAALETMRMGLPKDTDKAADGYDNTDTYLPKVNAPEFNTNGLDLGLSLPHDGYVARGGYGDFNEPAFKAAPNTTISTLTTNTGKPNYAGIANTALEAAPILYNTARGISRYTKTTRNYYNPTQYQYQDISAPARRAAIESYNIDKKNVRNVVGAAGQSQNYLQEASNNRYKRLSDINTFEGGRRMDVYNQNTSLANEAQLRNLDLNNMYNDMDLRNKARRNDFAAAGVSQASQFAQKQALQKSVADRDQAMTDMDKQRLQLFKDIYPNYAPDYSFDHNGNVVIKGVTYKRYRKGTRSVKKYSKK